MAEQKPKNNLAPKQPPVSPVNALRSAITDADQYRAYFNMYGFDDSTMTERDLSPKGIDFLRAMGAANFKKGVRESNKTVYADYPDKHPHENAMYETLGEVAKNNVRLVNIEGVPYYQVLDLYDFDLGTRNVKEEGWFKILKDAATGHSRRNAAENIAGGLELARNLNYLVPVDPARQASPEAVDAFRRQSDLKYPSQTLGTKVINHLRDAATPKHNEKAMP